MSYAEIIDNITTRIENLISERFQGTYQNITITPSDFNPDIDDEITLTIKVTDQNDDPITNWTVPLMINGVLVSETIKTDNNGEATYTYTCNNWGVCRFSVKSYTCFIKVAGWRTAVSDSNYEVLYNDELVSVTIHIDTNITYSPTVKFLGAEILKDGNIDLRPKNLISDVATNGRTLRVQDNDYRVAYFTVGTSQMQGGAYATFTYKRK